MTVLREGTFEDTEIIEMASRFGNIVLPDEGLCERITHWWVIVEDGRESLYVGTPETFATYLKAVSRIQ